MTRLLAVLALALVLVISLGDPARSGVIPWEDFDKPIDGRDLGDGGGEDDDHPWGGDRVLGGGLGDDTYRYVDIAVITGYPAFDVIVSRLIQSTTLEATNPVVSASDRRCSEAQYRRSYEAATSYRTRSTIGNWKER